MTERQGKARRAGKDWIKGNRERRNRIDANDDSLVARERIRPKTIAIEGGVTDLDSLVMCRVVKTGSVQYEVVDEHTSSVYQCNIKRGATTDNDNSTLVTIGDIVRILPLEDSRGLIYHIDGRTSRIGRKAVFGKGRGEHVIAANLDLLVCVGSADRPDFRRTIFDRYIVGALLGSITPVIVINKMDTVSGELEELLKEEMDVYRQIGYHLLFISAESGEGMEELNDLLKDNVSAVVGFSGVGKSSIVNTLLEGNVRETQAVRDRDKRGVHTSTDSVMFRIPSGKGYIIDTPGLREFGIWDLKPEELDGYFIEFGPYLQQCRYLPCTHTHEPDCAVVAAVEEGEIDEGRYASYLSIYDSLKEKKRKG